MTDRKSDFSKLVRLREQAFSQWDNESGTEAGSREHPALKGTASMQIAMTIAVSLRLRRVSTCP